jgi:hypothetical protein
MFETDVSNHRVLKMSEAGVRFGEQQGRQCIKDQLTSLGMGTVF